MAVNLRTGAFLALVAVASTSGCTSWPWSNGNYVGSASPPPPGLTTNSPAAPNYAGVAANGTTQARGGAVSFAPAEVQPTGFAAITASMQKSASAVGGWFTGGASEPTSDDPTRLDTPVKSPTSAMYVGWAKTNEQHGNVQQAEEFYRKAVELNPKDLVALISYARMFQRQDRLDQAIEVYRRAIAAHPNDPVAYNDMALCLARQQKYPQALETLEKAVRIEPDNKLYRGNLAMVLVEAGRTDEAFTQLSAAHTPDVAHYNLGYLLYKKGNVPAAVEHFAQAAHFNPNLKPAQTMLAKLGAAGRPPQTVGGPPSLPEMPANPNSPFAPKPGTPAVVANPHAGAPTYGQPAVSQPGAPPAYNTPPAYSAAPPAYPQPAGPEAGGLQQPYGGPILQSPANAAPPPLPEDYDNGQPRALPPVY